MRNGDGGWLIGGGCYGITRLLLRWFLFGWRMARYDLSFPFLLSSRNDWFGDDQLASLPAFETARCVKVNPDTPQKQVRFLTLNGNKILMTPQPRLRTGFFSILESSSIPYLPDACTSAGVAKFGKPISLDDKLKVDLIVIGSVAVDPKTGARLGKGEGFAELEYGILRWMGAIDDSTLVVTTVHDQQLVDDIPLEKLLIHDVPVDIICTPTQIIHTNTKIPKPKGQLGILLTILSPNFYCSCLLVWCNAIVTTQYRSL
ncbi:hypothetical protein KC19_8G190700 [Ceratodon purpureus]|uniref:5-formyltetrahydrofolate cyclo-ligase n=1 Tax=Ceratodon purpureus TaxID=3225 RepID=A0A8T0H0M3_CERPU|nr:hypothetical protein KC19_8G190700 [Ceratodon purpureus]